MPKGYYNTGQKIIRSHFKEEKASRWLGQNASVTALHVWVKKWKRSPIFCENCGKKGEKRNGRWNIHWANIDHSYRRVLEDYIGMCVSCHRIYDYKYNGYQKHRAEKVFHK